MTDRDDASGIESVVRSVVRGWAWVAGAMVVAAMVIGLSWVAEPEVFRTSVELKALPLDGSGLGGDQEALNRVVAAVGRQIVTVAVGGDVQEAVGDLAGESYGYDIAAPAWRKSWSEDWGKRLTAAGPVDGSVFLIVDDQDGPRGVATAHILLRALETEWRRRAEAFRLSGLTRLDLLIDQDMDRFADLMVQGSDSREDSGDIQGLVLVAERELAAQKLAALRLQRNRLESSGIDDPLPWVVVSKPSPFEHHIRKNPPVLIIISALAFVLLVAVGWVAWDSARDH